MHSRTIAPPVGRAHAPEPIVQARRRRPHRNAYDQSAERALLRQRLRTLLARGATAAIAILALADILANVPPLRWLSWIAAVLLAGTAALLAAAAAEHPATFELSRRRWYLQAVVGTTVMFTLMAGTATPSLTDAVWFVSMLATACALALMATTLRSERPLSVGALCLVLDAAIVGFTTLLIVLALSSAEPYAPMVLAAFAAAGYATAVGTRPTVRQAPHGSDALFLGAVAALCLYMGGFSSRELGFGLPAIFAAPGVALFGTLALARSAWLARSEPPPREAPSTIESRLRLVPAVAAAGALIVLSWAELQGDATRSGFFGVIVLFGLIVGRLLLTLVENRHLLQRVERSGVFEEKLRELGSALITALDRKDTLELVCRAAQMSLRADSVILWMLDPAAEELEAVEVLSSKRSSLLRRRLAMNDPTSLAVRVARTANAEIVANAASANVSNAFLNVLLRAQALLAVPVVRGETVQGVLVCIDSRNPSAYRAADLAKAELLASQVAVALDNAYQHALQRRRVEELSALYQFAQSAHSALTSVEIARQLLPIVKERLPYTRASIWLREEALGPLRLVANHSQEGAAREKPPSKLALHAVSTGQPARGGLDWADADLSGPAMRDDIVSQLAVPLVLKRRVVGVLDLESTQPQAYTPTEERLLVALVNHAALAIDNLQLLEESRKVQALRELDRMKTELLSTVSHELRTPLGSIKGYATTLLTHGQRLKRDEQREFLEIIDSEADRLRELIEQLLDMSRLEAGVLRIDREPAHLRTVAAEVVRKVQLATPRHTIAFDWPADDPLVAADTRRIYQVLQNLLTNAVKYSPEGGTITIGGYRERHDLVVSVQDEGLGMPATELDRIFDRFHRVGGDVARHIGGTGLGLAICKGLVDAHGGRIWAESEGEGRGSVFKFTLPLLPTAAEVTAPAPIAAAGASKVSRSKGADDHQEANRSRR